MNKDTQESSRKRKRKEETDESDSSSSDSEFDEEGGGPLSEVAKVINSCKKLARYGKKTGLNKKIQEKVRLCLVQENQTRWLSIHGMLNTVERSYDILIIILSEVNKLDMLTAINRKILKVKQCFNELHFRFLIESFKNSRVTQMLVISISLLEY
jgi:hypothetical protein